MEKIELIKNFLDFVVNPQQNGKLDKLEYYLIESYQICYKIDFRQGKMHKSTADYDTIRKMIGQNFKELGYYNDVLEIKDNLGETELVTGDALDDLTDIVRDFTNALTLKKENDILSSIKMDFEFHTKSHILNLLRYLTSEI